MVESVGQAPVSGTQNHHQDRDRLIQVLARKVREVEAKTNGEKKLGPTNRTKFQVIAFLMREERSRIKAETALELAVRVERLKRLDGIAALLARIAAKDTSLLVLLEGDKLGSQTAQRMRRDWLVESGCDLRAEDLIIIVEKKDPGVGDAELMSKQVRPASVRSQQLSNPFLAPDLSCAKTSQPVLHHHLDSWDLLGPLFRAFEQANPGSSACMSLPPVPALDRYSPRGQTLMPHQLEFLERVRAGHKTFLLADEPGLGKTAQSLLAASVAGTYPLLAVVPSVVKMNWAREVTRWTPGRKVTVIYGDGEDLDAFADVVVVNYDVLDRHLSWLSTMGFRGMVLDEAHFIKNMTSQRSKYVLNLANSIRTAHPQALMIALTGTPLINDIDDFRAIWHFLGWIKGEKPAPELLAKLEQTQLTPADSGFYSAARQSVIDMGIVRRRKRDVAADLPGRRVVDLPVELDSEDGRSLKHAEKTLVSRLVKNYRSLLNVNGLSESDLDREQRLRFMKVIAQRELEDSRGNLAGDNIFTMVRKIGQAKTLLAVDYAAQLAHSVGKVVFFAKHLDVLDQTEEVLKAKHLKIVSIRGDQSAAVRQKNIDAFMNDPHVSVAVCSLLSAGVGVNLHVASNVVLAELSWTAAEQTQAIDRVHRIGQVEPVTAWRILAAGTLDMRIAELIDAKQGLAARALDGQDVEEGSADSVQLDALVQVLSTALGG